MATKSFLTADEEVFALKNFAAPNFLTATPTGGLGSACAKWLGERLRAKLEEVPDWLNARPVALGSWARGELCPKSDIDVIFCGSEEIVQKVVGQIQARGLRLRSRVPQDLNDWTIGVEPFDVLAILHGQTFDPLAAAQLQVQQDLIRSRGEKFARSLLVAIENEKVARSLRFDSVANYLEPNIKYGPGGLRDLEQALSVRRLFEDRFAMTDAAADVFRHYKFLWLAIRQRLHLMGGGDLLSGPEQPDLAKAFGFTELKDFMREFQRGISEVNFYANWVIAKARKTRWSKPRRLKTFNDALKTLERDPSVLTQAEVRFALPHLKGPADLATVFKVTQKEAWFGSLFDSHLLDHWLKDITRLRGHVQHDHYHRFTADAHLLQAIKQVVRARRRPKFLGRLAFWAKAFTLLDWQILLWTALFHDLAKGKGGDHSQKGRELAETEMRRLDLSEDLIHEVKWMVQNHLLLSTAAFRMNVQEPATWRHLHGAGAVGARLSRLAVFTALDICATNPEAWNDWKERLLADLLTAMQSAEAAGFMNLLAKATSASAKEVAAQIDPAVAQAVPTKKLLADLARAGKSKKDLSPLALRNRRGEMWVRFHSSQDRPGLFLQYVAKLFALGCSIQQSSVRTLPKVGVYDWFQVRTTKRPAQILKQLDLIKDWTEVEPPQVRLNQIEVISEGDGEIILSFRGKDQKGVLLATAKALFELGFTVRWAKVITWGSQIDDIFCVQREGGDLSAALESMRTSFNVKKD
ncbi:MAG: HD domain-containing protein [Bdellovibrionales bacterium]